MGADRSEDLLRMEGVVEHVIFENRDTGYAVFEVNAGGELHVVTGEVGEVSIDGSFWRAVAETEIHEGRPVRVLGTQPGDALMLRVAPFDGPSGERI